MKRTLKIIGLSLAGLFILLVIIGRTLGEPPAKAEQSATQAVIPEPETSEPSPEGRKALPGLSPVDVYVSLENRGFEVKKEFSEHYASWTCVQKWPSLELTAEVIGPNADEVGVVRAMVMADGVTKTAAAGSDFVAFVASAPYEGSDPQTAHDWVIANFDQDSATTQIGGAHFTLRAPSAVYRMLTIEPVR